MRRAQNFIPYNYKTKPIQCQAQVRQVRQVRAPAPNSPTPHSFAQTNSTSPPSPEGRGWASTRLFNCSLREPWKRVEMSVNKAKLTASKK